MHEESSQPARRLGAPQEPTFAQVHAQFGARWQIERSTADVWDAVERPSETTLHVIVGPTLNELAGKLAYAEQQKRDGASAGGSSPREERR
jgi:hypothetical protein